MRERDFNLELHFFLNKIKNDQNFSLSRWGDGELIILEDKSIDLTKIKNGEFKYEPNDEKYRTSRELLMEAYKYIDDEYYVGVACSCCVGKEKFDYMKNLFNGNEKNLTWANIFVNSNFKNFISDYVNDIFKKKKIILIANHMANINKLPFKVEKQYYVGVDAWYENLELVNELQSYINNNEIKNHLFLFAAGPLANILASELWKFNKNNTYIDVGSVLDVELGMKPTRGYLKGAPTLKKKCIW